MEGMGIVDIDIGGLHRKSCLAFTRAMYEAFMETSAKQTKEKYMENIANFKAQARSCSIFITRING